MSTIQEVVLSILACTNRFNTMRVCKREKKMQQSMFRSNSMKYSSMANFEYNVIRQYSPRCTDFQNIKSSASHESA